MHYVFSIITFWHFFGNLYKQLEKTLVEMCIYIVKNELISTNKDRFKKVALLMECVYIGMNKQIFSLRYRKTDINFASSSSPVLSYLYLYEISKPY